MKKTPAPLLRGYNEKNAADKIGVGFEIDGFIRLALIDRLPRSYTYADRQAHSHGGNKSIRLRLTIKQMRRLLPRAIIIGTAEQMNGVKNRGEQLERLVFARQGKEWKRSRVPFWVAGDIEIDGKQVQLKYTGATVCTYKQIKKLLNATGEGV